MSKKDDKNHASLIKLQNVRYDTKLADYVLKLKEKIIEIQT